MSTTAAHSYTIDVASIRATRRTARANANYRDAAVSAVVFLLCLTVGCVLFGNYAPAWIAGVTSTNGSAWVNLLIAYLPWTFFAALLIPAAGAAAYTGSEALTEAYANQAEADRLRDGLRAQKASFGIPLSMEYA